ncbi:MAG: iron ABC transporter permease [Planctomycetota bacterium]
MADDSANRRGRARVRAIAATLAAVLAVLVVLSVSVGDAGAYSVGDTLRGGAAWLGLAEPLDAAAQVILEARLERTFLTIGVGAALALSGGMLQGVYRNDLASPGLLGVTSGAALGASLAILALGGYGPLFAFDHAGLGGALFVTVCAFLGAAGVTAVVTALGTTGGRVSIPTLLLVGIAMNAILGGLVSAIQSFALNDFEVARALFAWGFGNLDDRGAAMTGFVVAAVAIAALAIPFVAVELDLFVAGEDDARSLGVETGRVKWIALLSSALAASAAVAVAGQIGFVGLIVPHLVRMAASRSHRVLLPMCLLAGPVLLLGCEVVQRGLLQESALRPGVTMSLLGGPFFLVLLVRNRRRIQAW